MERHASLLLDVWREVCRHIEIGESIQRLGPILLRRLPVDAILIRRLDPARCCVESVATGHCLPGSAGMAVPGWSGPTSPRPIWSNWSSGAVRARCFAGPNTILRLERLPGLLPEGLEGQVLAGRLIVPDAAAGVLILVGSSRHEPARRAW